MTKKSLHAPAVAEIIFDITYLLFAAAAGIYLLAKGDGQVLPSLYGSLALILGFGDGFHLLPRVYSLYTDTMSQHIRSLGFGKMVTSITMTIFYVLLYEFWQLFYRVDLPSLLTVLVFGLAALRIALCLIPRDQWIKPNPAIRFSIYRNIPFVLLGTIILFLFASSALQGSQDSFLLMAPAILFSFLFYLIVVLFAGKNPKLGAFMLPKTCVYIWMICMGFSLV